jgi:predicted transcriptional regulator
LSRRVGIDVWDKALEAAINDLGAAVFDHWFHEASAEEAKVLSLIAPARGPVSAKDIEEAAEVRKIRISSASITKYLQRLSDKRIISRTSRGMYAIQDRMFRAYIASHERAD